MQYQYYIMLHYISLFIDNQGLCSLKEAALKRLDHSLRPGSRVNYKAYFAAFMLFATQFQVDIHQLHYSHVLSFIEWLVMSNLSHATICNYLSGIKYYCNLYNLSCDVFDNPHVNKMLVACARSVPAKLKNKHVFTPQIMSIIVQSTVISSHPSAYSALFLLAFHGFFRISNLLPPSHSSFNPLQHLARGDVIFAPPGVHIIIKWSKTLQSSNSCKIIKLPTIPNSTLCPTTALRQFIALNPIPKNQPFFSVSSNQSITSITQKQARSTLSSILTHIGLNSSHYSFHTFRHSGATLAFQLGVPLQDIQAHGTWASQAVWHYTSTANNSNIPTTFSNYFSNH